MPEGPEIRRAADRIAGAIEGEIADEVYFAFDALKPKKRGPKAKEPDPHPNEVARLRRENERLRQKLENAELIIDVQKKVSRLLGIPLQNVDGDGPNRREADTELVERSTAPFLVQFQRSIEQPLDFRETSE